MRRGIVVLAIMALLVASVGVAGCAEEEEKEVTAGFSASPTFGTPPLAVQFIDASTGEITQWAWDFGDGGTSTERSPSHTYDAAGEYTVSLTVTGPDASDTETKANYIEVGEVIAAFTASPTSGPPPLEVQFTDQSVGGITAWEWDFDTDGTVDSTSQNPSYTYETAGDYTVSLTVTAPAGSDTEMKGKYIEVLAAEEVVITIGSQTDFTGPAASAMVIVNYALEDMVKYYNAENLIPGVTLEVIFYDNQYNPTRDEPGYIWLKERGADLMVSGLPPVGETVKPLADEDKIVNFSMVNNEPMYTLPDGTPDPGYVFTMNVPGPSFLMTLMKWIAENQWDWETKGPAKIGGAGFIGPYQMGLQKGIGDYAAAHPDQFELVDLFLASWTTFDWSTQVEALLDCDYLCPPSTSYGLTAFVDQYRAAGGEATLLFTDAHPAYLGLLVDAVGWEEIDGTLDVFINGWWGEDRSIVQLGEQLLDTYHDDASEIMAGGVSYLGPIHMLSMMLDTLAGYINSLDSPHDFDREGYYQFLQTYEGFWDDYEDWGYTTERRWPFEYVGLYEWSADAQSLVRLEDAWLPAVLEP